MKYLFVYTIEAAGGRFLQSMLKVNQPPEQFCWLGDIHLKQRGLTTGLGKEVISAGWVHGLGANYLTPKEKHCSVVAFHHHHVDPESSKAKALKSLDPGVSVLATMRDPLLIINTWRWRDYILKGIYPGTESDEARLTRAKHITALVDNLLSVPGEHMFICTVDTMHKVTMFEKLFEFCELPFSPVARMQASAWTPIGLTSTNKYLRSQSKAQEFLQYKNAILESDTDDIHKLMDVEYQYLREQTDLQEKLEAIGYKNLSWWR